MPLINLSSPTQSDVATALRQFLLDTLPHGVDVILGDDNRVPEPDVDDFIVMSPIRFERISTNYDSLQDVKFIGSISGTTMSVSSVDHGVIVLGATVFGSDIINNTVITGFGTGSGGVGTYTVSNSQSKPSRVLAAGYVPILVSWKHTIQCDFHSVNTTSSDAASSVAAVLRDEYGTRFFSRLSSPMNMISPLYTDEPKYIPFLNESKQIERRWVLDVVLQVNQLLGIPMQYADTAVVGLIEVDEFYPPQ